MRRSRSRLPRRFAYRYKEGLAQPDAGPLDRGDTVLVPNPSYPIHIYGAVIAGADIRSVRMTRDVDFFLPNSSGRFENRFPSRR